MRTVFTNGQVTKGSDSLIGENFTTYTCVANTVAVGDAVYISDADNKVGLADADDAAKRPPVGVVAAYVTDATTCVVAHPGAIVSGLSLTRGDTHWLTTTGTTGNTRQNSKPATNAYCLGVAVSGTELLVTSAGATGDTGATGDAGATGEGVVAGGTATQVLAKIDGTNYNTEWVDRLPARCMRGSSAVTIAVTNTVIPMSTNFSTPTGYAYVAANKSIRMGAAGTYDISCELSATQNAGTTRGQLEVWAELDVGAGFVMLNYSKRYIYAPRGAYGGSVIINRRITTTGADSELRIIAVQSIGDLEFTTNNASITITRAS